MYVAQLWPSACPCTLIVVPMRVLFPATSSYLVDVSPTHSFARCVGLVGRLGLGRAHVRMDSSRLYSSSKPTSDSDLRSALSLKCLPRVASSLEGTAFVKKTSKGLDVSHRIPFPSNKKYYKLQWVGGGLLRCFRYGLGWVPGGFPVGSRRLRVGSSRSAMQVPAGSRWVPGGLRVFLSLSHAV